MLAISAVQHNKLIRNHFAAGACALPLKQRDEECHQAYCVSFCVFRAPRSLEQPSALPTRGHGAAGRMEWQSKSAWIPLKSGRFGDTGENAPRDRGKGLTPAPGQRARSGGAGTAHPDPQPVRIKRHTQGDLPVTLCSRVQRLCQRSLVRAEVYPPHRFVLTEAKLKRDRFLTAPQNGRRRKAFLPFKTCRSAERKRKRSRLPTGELRPSEHKYEF